MLKPLVTVAILTFNGERYLEDILTSVEQQDCSFKFEILVIDSGSSDGTLHIVGRHPEVRLHQIPNSEFGHGKTRNLAAHLASGEYIAYLTHDAIPAHDRWLTNIVGPMQINHRVMGVLGKQVPRTGCVPMLKYEIQLAFARQGASFGMTILNKSDVEFASPFEQNAMKFYSDVNSATRVELLTGTLPYRDVDYAEDQMFAEDFLDQGFSKAYAPQAAVIHSNDLELDEIGPRTFDEILALRKLGHKLQPFSTFKLVGVILKKSVGDTIRMIRDPQLKGRRFAYWLLVNPIFIAKKWHGYNKACRVNFGDAETIARSSLEARKKA